METLKNIIETYNWLSEAFVHQTEETTEQDTLDSYSLENMKIYYKTNNQKPISYWTAKSDIPELIISNTYDEISDTGMLVFKEPVTSIGKEAFAHSPSLKDITIPKGVKSIGKDAFLYCRHLTSVTIPESVTSIESGAFYYCCCLKSITIPESVTSIGNLAFDFCESLEKVFYKGEEYSYKNKSSLINALKNSKVSLGAYHMFGCTRFEIPTFI